MGVSGVLNLLGGPGLRPFVHAAGPAVLCQGRMPILTPIPDREVRNHTATLTCVAWAT